MFPILKERSIEAEIMDDLSIEGPMLTKNLDELTWVYKFLGGKGLTLKALKTAIKGIQPGATINILDIGCGGGDSLKTIADWAAKNKIFVELHGIDANPAVVKYAREKAATYSNIRFSVIDIFDKKMDWSGYDIIYFALVLHHFTEEEQQKLLTDCFKSKAKAVVVNDLHRSGLALVLFRILSFVLRFSRMSKEDGSLSIRKGFHKHELEKVFQSSGYTKYTVKWKWAFRYLAIGYPIKT